MLCYVMLCHAMLCYVVMLCWHRVCEKASHEIQSHTDFQADKTSDK